MWEEAETLAGQLKDYKLTATQTYSRICITGSIQETQALHKNT